MEEQNSAYSLSSQELLELRSWGLPESVLKQYELLGIQTMFPWQAECLNNPRVLEGANLVYSAPTSAGKSLVAEILMLKRVFEKKTKAILIFPFVSLAREKMFGLRKILKHTRIRVGGFMGNVHPPGGLQSVDIAVCTIEKANGLVNRLLQERALSSLGCVVVDELHLLGDPSRGYLLELMLTKIRYLCSPEQDSCNASVQIIGMSATLPNLDLLARWLQADLYQTEFRPVPLLERIKMGNQLLDTDFNLVRLIQPNFKVQNDSDHLIFLCLETLLQGFSVLVFCPTKNWCENLADTLAKAIFELGKIPPSSASESSICQRLRQELDGRRIAEVLEQLKRCPAGLDASLAKTVSFAVAYHHAGLTMDERDIVEGAFRQGVLRILVATSTLSSGVNLPARRVIVRCPFTFQNQLIDTLTYRQMIGRAGRKGIDTEGESVLFCRDNEKHRVAELVMSSLKPVTSCLVQANSSSPSETVDDSLCSSMKRAILEIIVSGMASTEKMVEAYISCTMLAASSVSVSAASCIHFLQANEFIRLQKCEGSATPRFCATQLGLACLASSLSPDDGLTVLEELKRARRCFVLENDLHILYQVIPIYAAVGWPNLDWMHYFSLWESLTPDVKRVGELVGVDEVFLIRAMRGSINVKTPNQARLLAIHQRFYTALALQDLVNEMPLKDVSVKYGASKGMLQSLQQAASAFAGMVTIFASKLGWHNIALLIGQYQDRLQFGIQRELIDLCRLDSLNGQRARLLFNAGIESVAQLANTNAAQVENLLVNSAPFESTKQADGETERQAQKRNQVRSFWLTGKKGLTEAEAARLIIDEARDLLQADLGIKITTWEENMASPVKVKSQDLSLGATKCKGKTRSGKSKKAKRTRSRPCQRSSVMSPGQQNRSFDVTAQLAELFEQEADVVEGGSPRESVKENPANVSQNKLDNKLKATSSSPLPTPPPLRCGVGLVSAVANSEEQDIFGDTLADLDFADFSKAHLFEESPSCSTMTPTTKALQSVEACSPLGGTTPLLQRTSSSRIKSVQRKVANGSRQQISPGMVLSSDSDTEGLGSPICAPRSSKTTLAVDMIDVCSSKTQFEKFGRDWRRQESFALAITCSQGDVEDHNQSVQIASSVLKKKSRRSLPNKPLTCAETGLTLTGITVSWDNVTCYFISLSGSHDSTPESTSPLSLDERIKLVCEVLQHPRPRCVYVYLAKEMMRVLCMTSGIMMSTKLSLMDPAVAAWMLQPGSKPRALHQMVVTFCPNLISLLPVLRSLAGSSGDEVGCRGFVTLPSEAAALAVITRHLVCCLKDKLVAVHMWSTFTNVEMPCIRILVKMELNGFGMHLEQVDKLRDQLTEFVEQLETKAHRLAGRKFCLSSPSQVCRVLYRELGLSLPSSSGSRGAAGSSSKEDLMQLEALHDLPKVILEWRQLNAALSKVLCPVSKLKVFHPALHMHRIHPTCLTFSATGRISFAEPNLQNVAKDFEINHVDATTSISLRSIFAACSVAKCVLISADYCQIELRILAHMSGDQNLCRILRNADADVFKSVASIWKQKAEAEVTDKERNEAKAICYGMLYGMGSKSLSEQMNVTQEDAATFQLSFRQAYPSVMEFIDRVVDDCRRRGYVLTLEGRRRYLPNIQASEHHVRGTLARAAAERQAINSTIQGSACDLVKKAMIRIDASLAKHYPATWASLRRLTRSGQFKGGFLVMQLHDELIYEVSADCVTQVASLIKQGMESSLRLSVPTPVRMKSGLSWGQLKPFTDFDS